MAKDILKDAKILGGIGAILLVCAFVPYIGVAAALAGIILLLVSYNKVANYAKKQEIWKRTLTWFILNLVNVVLLIIFVIIGFLIISSSAIVTPLLEAGTIPLDSGVAPFYIPAALIALLIIGFLIVYAIMIIASWNFFKANESLSKVTKNGNFRTAGLLNFIGAIATIVILGVIVSWVGNIILAIAFFTGENR